MNISIFGYLKMLYKSQPTFKKLKKLALHLHLNFTVICLFNEEFIMHKGEVFSGSG